MRRLLLLPLLPLAAALFFFLLAAPTPLVSIIFASGGSSTPNVTATPVPSPSESDAPCVSSKPVFLTLPSVSKHKESKYAFGNPVKVSANDSNAWGKTMDALLSTVHKDPSIAAVMTAVFIPDNSLSKIDNSTAGYLQDHKEWCQETAMMYKIASGAFVKLEPIEAGMKTLCMVKSPDGVAPVTVYECPTARSGTAALFKWKDSEGHNRTALLRLDCRFQPVQSGHFAGVPVLPKKYTATPKPTHTTPATHHPAPSHSTPPKPKPSPKNTAADPAPRGHAKTGGGTNKDPGPGKSVAPSDAPTVPSTPYTPPPAPSAN